MPKRTLSPEHLAKLQAGRLKKRQENQTKVADKPQVTLDEDKFKELMDRLARLEESKTQTLTSPPNQGFDQFGKPQGVMQKYSIDPSYYNDPRDGLYDLPELKRQAMRENFHIDWEVEQLIYETKYGTSFSEPKFTLTLFQKRFDDEGKEIVKTAPDGKVYHPRIVRQVGIFFEDPVAAIKVAQELGLPIDNANTREFLEQMRFMRYKQWLLEIFNPTRPTSTATKRHQEVIGGKVYQVEAYSNVI